MSEEKTINRVRQLDPGHATGKTRQLFESVAHRLGRVPNLFRVLGNARAALEGYLNFGAALAAGALDAKVREQISWQWPRPTFARTTRVRTGLRLISLA